MNNIFQINHTISIIDTLETIKNKKNMIKRLKKIKILVFVFSTKHPLFQLDKQ